jgi:hypothetical protein
MFTWSESPYQDMWNHLRAFSQAHNVRKLLTGQLRYKNEVASAYLYPSEDVVISKSKQIAMCVRQADEYFMAAEAVSVTTSPLMLFYGASSLAKALIVARCPDKDLSDIKYHGLDTRPKSQEIASYSESPSSWRLEDEYAYANNGAFLNFCKALNTYQFEVGTLFRFKSILKMYPELAEFYKRFFGELPPIIYVSNITQKQNPFVLSFCTRQKDHLEDSVFPELKELFEIGETDRERSFVSKGLTSSPSKLDFFTPYVGGRYIVRGLEHEVNGFLHFQNCHPAAVDFIGLFTLSMCVRYKQLLWRSVVEGEESGTLGIILPYIQTVKRRYPNYILDHLTGEKHDYGAPGRMI